MERWPLAYWFLLPGLKFFIKGFFPITVVGLEHVPLEGGALLVGNHPSFLDGLLFAIYIDRPVRYVASLNLYHHPLLHWMFANIGCIPVYPGQALKNATGALQKGRM